MATRRFKTKSSTKRAGAGAKQPRIKKPKFVAIYFPEENKWTEPLNVQHHLKMGSIVFNGFNVGDEVVTLYPQPTGEALWFKGVIFVKGGNYFLHIFA